MDRTFRKVQVVLGLKSAAACSMLTCIDVENVKGSKGLRFQPKRAFRLEQQYSNQ